MRPATAPTLLLTALLAAAPLPAAAQMERVALGGAIGVAGGAVVTFSGIVARARWQEHYIASVEDLIDWHSVPMIAAPAAGAIFGLAGEKAHKASIVGSTGGMLAGALIGTGLGHLVADDPEAPWAYAIVGAGVGLSIGGLAAGFIAWRNDEDPLIDLPKFLRFSVTLPVP
jgi:hypothetical protein